MFFLASLIFSCGVAASDSLSEEERKVAEIYARYVSNKLFVDLCSVEDTSSNYEKLLKNWVTKNQETIEIGKAILQRYYLANGLKMDQLFNSKTSAEKKYFRESAKSEKSKTCKNIVDDLSDAEQ